MWFGITYCHAYSIFSGLYYNNVKTKKINNFYLFYIIHIPNCASKIVNKLLSKFPNHEITIKSIVVFNIRREEYIWFQVGKTHIQTYMHENNRTEIKELSHSFLGIHLVQIECCFSL